MEFKTKRKSAVAFVLSMLIFMLSVVYCMPKIADAADANGRDYLRHDYSGLTPDEIYNLKLEMNNNTSNTYTVSNQSDYVLENDIAVVRIDGPDEVIGTCFIIDKHTIVTAAHCVYSIPEHGFIDFTISMTDSMGRVVKNMKPKYVHVPLLYINTNNPVELTAWDNDYAMIEVEEDLSGFEMFNLGVITNEFINQKSAIIVSGYPSVAGNENSDKKYTANGNISGKKRTTIIIYDIETFGGLSGGPVYVERELFGKKYKTAIGIHICGYGHATRITSDLLKFYYSNHEKK